LGCAARGHAPGVAIRAGWEVVGIKMPVRALNKAVLRFGNCLYPCRCSRTLARVLVPIDKAAPDELGERGMKQIEFRNIFRRAYGQARRSCIGESSSGDAFFHRREIPFSQPLRPEAMVALYQ